MLHHKSTFHLWLLLPIILFMTFIGGRGLNMDPLFYNGEIISVAHAGGVTGPYSPGEIIDSVRMLSPQHGPLYFLLLGAWGNILGWQPFMLRLLSLFFGLLTIAITYRLGRDLFSPLAGLCAAAVMGTSFYLIDYTHNIRMYTMMPMLLAFILWLYQRLMQPRHVPRVWEWVALFILTAAAIYTHYLSAMVLGAIGFYHLIFARKNRRWLEMSAVMTLAVLTFLPWVPVLVFGEEERKDLTETVLSPLGTFDVLGYLFGNGLTVLTALAVFLAAIPLWRKQRNTVLVWVIFAVTLIAILLANVLSPLVPADRSRYFLIVWPLLAVLVGLGLAQLRRWPLVIVALLAIWLVSGFVVDQDPYFNELKSTGGKRLEDYPDYPLITASLLPYIQPQDLVILFTDHISAERGVGENYYYPSTNYYYFHLLNAESIIYRIPKTLTVDEIKANHGEALMGRTNVWLISEPFRSRLPASLENFRTVLSENYEDCGLVVEQPELHIEQFVKDSNACVR